MATSNREAIRNRSKKSKPQAASGLRDGELQEILDSVSLLDVVRQDTGESGKRSGNYYAFRRSPWGAHDSLRVYPKTNSYKEFSANHEGGGTAIDYFMQRDNCDQSKAVDTLRRYANQPRKQQTQAAPQPVLARSNGLPPIKPLKLHKLPTLAPELVSGVLRVGHKAIIQGASKAGKTWLLIQLAIAIATGSHWIGLKCKQGRVLYLNFEVDEASFLHRCQNVAKARGSDLATIAANIDVWCLRGRSESMQNFTSKLIAEAKEKQYSAIILDPIYKVMDGDENSAADVRIFCNCIDQICEEVGCSVIYCHHHSKGSKADAAAIDRGSGSGVFGRDPDAIIDLIQLFDPDGAEKTPEGATAWRVAPTLREFPHMEPFDILASIPVHNPAMDLLEGWTPNRQQQKASKSAVEVKAARKQAESWEITSKIAAYFMAHQIGEEGEDANAIEAMLGMERRTLKRRLSVCPYFEYKSGANASRIVPAGDAVPLQSHLTI